MCDTHMDHLLPLSIVHHNIVVTVLLLFLAGEGKTEPGSPTGLLTSYSHRWTEWSH